MPAMTMAHELETTQQGRNHRAGREGSSGGTAPSARGETPATVVFRRGDVQAPLRDHDVATKVSVVRSMAELLGLGFAGELDPAHPPDGPLYIVPSDTLLSLAEAAGLGIHGPQDLFGGVVPSPFVATKLITHPLVRSEARAPPGWSKDFGEQVAEVVLPGYSVFTLDDAKLAGERLLADGAARSKDSGGVGGSGQAVIVDRLQLDAMLASMDPAALLRDGLVLERNLNEVTTQSVGQVRIGRWLASYCGTQGLTRNHQGDTVYGGSSLTVVQGGFDALLELALDAPTRTAVEQARVYDAAAMACFKGMYASRSNYDVAQGVDDTGRWCSGVLEQSWRIGGASGAEIAALHAFRANPALAWVRASTHEVYADKPMAPSGAHVHFDGTDPHVGRLLKYATVDEHGNL